MRLINTFLLILVIGLITVSCNDTKKEREANKTITTEQTDQQPARQLDNTATLPGNNTATTVTPGQTMTPATAPGMNPPHGEPGHDCKIPVGAPLGSAPQGSATTAQPLQVQPAGPRMNTPTTLPVTQTAPGMNPPHGQPGHDCKIPVGAPLNSGK